MKIVVTGYQGQLGTALTRQLGDEVVGVDLPVLDMIERDAVLQTLVALRPRAVIHTAAYTDAANAERQPKLCRAINVQGTGYVVEACVELDCPLLLASSTAVFGDPENESGYRESDPPSPRGTYAQSKYEAEQTVARWDKHFIVRSSGLYGPAGPRARRSFLYDMLQQAEEGQPLRLPADRCSSWTCTLDLARALRFLIGTGAYGIYHVVNRGASSWYEFGCELFRLLDRDVTIEPQRGEEPPPAWGISRVVDTTKYHRLHGAPPMPTWQEALARFLGEHVRAA